MSILELGCNFVEILRMIKGFPVADAQGLAIPFNWINEEVKLFRLEPSSVLG